jgi:sugar phosphate permease
MRKVAIFIFVLAILAGLVVLQYRSKQSSVLVVTPQAGLFVDTPVASAVVSSPLVVSGHVDGTNRWTGFEGQVGSVTLLDSNGNVLAQMPLTATTDWMQFPTSFSTTLTFSAPTTDAGVLIFRNENASGMTEYEREFRLPVKFK